MKRTLPVILIFCALLSRAQETATPKDTSWKISGFMGLNITQTKLNNWQGGGQENVTISGIINAEAIYKRDKFEEWYNKLDAQFGLIGPGDSRRYRKNNDQLLFITKYNTKAFEKHWFWAVQADYRTQFAPGYVYASDTVVGRAVSDLNSPGYLQAALGLDYKPVDYFSLMFAPVAGKITFVNRQYLADDGAFGVKEAERDTAGNITKRGSKVRYEFGGRIVMKFKKDIFKNVNLDSYLDLFTNYLEKPGNVDVVFNNLLVFKINKFFSATVLCQMLYDDDIIIKDGDGAGPRLQVLTTWGIGLGYKF